MITIELLLVSASPLGFAIGITLFGYVFDVTQSYFAVFITVIVLFVVSLITSFIALNYENKFIEEGVFN